MDVIFSIVWVVIEVLVQGAFELVLWILDPTDWGSLFERRRKR
jgi:hypothetical protein